MTLAPQDEARLTAKVISAMAKCCDRATKAATLRGEPLVSANDIALYCGLMVQELEEIGRKADGEAGGGQAESRSAGGASTEAADTGFDSQRRVQSPSPDHQGGLYRFFMPLATDYNGYRLVRAEEWDELNCRADGLVIDRDNAVARITELESQLRAKEDGK